MRPPEVFVRELSHAEATRLKRMAKSATHQSTRQRAGILHASLTRHTAPQIARMWMTDESHVREVIPRVQRAGALTRSALTTRRAPRRTTASERTRIVAVAGARPDPAKFGLIVHAAALVI